MQDKKRNERRRVYRIEQVQEYLKDLYPGINPQRY